jgi:hypothetical protein
LLLVEGGVFGFPSGSIIGILDFKSDIPKLFQIPPGTSAPA